MKTKVHFDLDGKQRHILISGLYEPIRNVSLRAEIALNGDIETKKTVELSDIEIDGADEYELLVGGGLVTRNLRAIAKLI